MKKFSAVFLSCLALASTAFAATNAADEVRIGLFEPFTGNSGLSGRQEALGVQFGHDEAPAIAIGGKTRQIRLVKADTASSPDGAVKAAQELISAGVSLVLGSNSSEDSMAASRLFADAGIPALGIGCTNPQVTEGNAHYFRLCFIDPLQGAVLADYAFNEMKARTAYCIGEQGNAYDAGLCHYFKDAFEKLGGKVFAEMFPTGTSNFSTYITNAKNYGADVLFCPTSLAYSVPIITEAGTGGAQFPILGGDSLDNTMTAEAACKAGVHLTVSSFYHEGETPSFDEHFREWLGTNPKNLKDNGGLSTIAAISAMGCDAYHVALEALRDAGTTDSRKVMEALGNVKYMGVTGMVSFDKNGDAIRETVFVKTLDFETRRWSKVAERHLGDVKVEM
ncbi:MAG: ABC transporter substrate-binding protein [Pyramidobacter sp.]|jgi:branched-chain amino acid transport system substrate-binding protein